MYCTKGNIACGRAPGSMLKEHCARVYKGAYREWPCGARFVLHAAVEWQIHFRLHGSLTNLQKLMVPYLSPLHRPCRCSPPFHGPCRCCTPFTDPVTALALPNYPLFPSPFQNPFPQSPLPLQVNRLGDPAAAFHLARQYEGLGRTSEAIKFYALVRG